MWRDARLIARHDLRRMLLARETLLWTFAMPVIFFYFLGTVTGGFRGAGPGSARPPSRCSEPTAAASSRPS